MSEKPAAPAVEQVADGVLRLSVRTPFPVGPVNLYLIDAGELCLVDTGTRTRETWEDVEQCFRQAGKKISDLRKIFVTHGHLDHFGLSRRFLEASPARLYVHTDDVAAVAHWERWIEVRLSEYVEVGRYWGIPEQYHDGFRRYFGRLAPLCEPVDLERIRPMVGQDETVRAGDVELRVLHCPGHTEGLVCFFDQKRGLLFAGDHLLEDITPNPNLYVPQYRGRRTGLPHYIASLRAIEQLEVANILPGHGAPYGGFRERIGEILRHHADRKQKILSLLGPPDRPSGRAGEREPTILELVQALWKDLPLSEYFLALREVHGHLEILEAEGKVRCRMDGGIARFRED